MIIKQILEALLFLQVYCSIVHTDLKLENILLVNDRKIVDILQRNKRYNSYSCIHQQLEYSQLKVKLIDFGGAIELKIKKTKNTLSYKKEELNSMNLDNVRYHLVDSIVNTRQYRSPEVTLRSGWDFTSDIWSVGCILYEIFSGNLLFETHNELEHLALIENITGQRLGTTKCLINLSTRKSEFFKYNQYLERYQLRWPDDTCSKESIVHVNTTRSIKFKVSQVILLENREYDCQHEKVFVDLLYSLLDVDPTKRINSRIGVLETSRILEKMLL